MTLNILFLDKHLESSPTNLDTTSDELPSRGILSGEAISGQVEPHHVG